MQKHDTYTIGKFIYKQKHSEFSHKYDRFSGHFQTMQIYVTYVTKSIT